MRTRVTVTAALLASALVAACGGKDTPASPTATAVAASPTPSPTTTAIGGLPSMYSQFYGVQVSLDGTTVVLRATSVPGSSEPVLRRRQCAVCGAADQGWS